MPDATECYESTRALRSDPATHHKSAYVASHTGDIQNNTARLSSIGSGMRLDVARTRDKAVVVPVAYNPLL